MNENQCTQQLLEALQKTQAILANQSLDKLSGCLPEAIDQYAVNQKLIERFTAGK